MSASFSTMITGTCPNCQQASAFQGVFLMREKCPKCGAVFMRDPGSWTGATAVGYIGGSVFATLLIAVMWATGTLFTWGEWVVPVSTCAFILLTFRLSKGLWLGILYDMEQVYPDPAPALTPPARAPELPEAGPA
jgi:uncharacterized protein (DUF983 family)